MLDGGMTKLLMSGLDERERQTVEAAADLIEERDKQDTEMIKLVALRRSNGRRPTASSWLFLRASAWALHCGAEPRDLIDKLTSLVARQGDKL